MSEGTGSLTLRVGPARKQDAGRGIARLPTAAQTELGVLSGDPIVVEGESLTVAKVWPGDDGEEVIRIDGDTRASAGTTVGETVEIRKATVADAVAVRLQPAEGSGRTDPNSDLLASRLLDRLLRPGKRIRLEGLGAYLVAETTPDGSVRVTEDTQVSVDSTGAVPPRSADSGGQSSDSETEDGPPSGATTYEDIGGLDAELEAIRELIELPLAEPETFGRLGIDPPSGVLLYGPPGTGKTLIARAVANEVDAYFDVISGPEIVSKYKGESEERLREAFQAAAENAPAIVFVDEIDSIAGRRDDDADMENRVVAQLLTLMDGLEGSDRVIVVGATNRVDTVDPALRRGGRFDREVQIGVPDEAGRREILSVHARDVPLAEDVDLDDLAARTHGFVGADLATLVREAAMAAVGDDREEVRVTGHDVEAALAAVEPSAMREYVAEQPAVTFADVGGLDGPERRLREAVEWPLSYGPLFEAAATEPPSGVLLYGPPGTGKTLLARAIAGESGVNFVRVAGPELLDRYVGESEEAIREAFERARRTAPAILFVDEIDAIAGPRTGSDEVTGRVVSQLLAELDRAADHPNLVVLAATNRREALDPALLRPGRLERHVEVPLPDEEGRREILAVHTAETPLGADVDLDAIATEATGFSGADVEALVRAASLRAIREVATDVEPEAAADRAGDVTVERRHFEAAMADVAADGETS